MSTAPVRRVASAFLAQLAYCLNLRASRIFLACFFVWLLLFQYGRVKFWRDPHSAFFQEDHVYDMGYSLYREREAWHFISRHNSDSRSPDYLKGGSTPSVCAAIVTVRRDLDHYFEASVGSLLEGLDEKERQALYLRVLFADTDPRVHPSWGQRWVDRLVDSAETYNVSDAELVHLQHLETERNFYEKGVFDYIYALQSCQKINASYIIIFEDDIILATGWFSKTVKALTDIARLEEAQRRREHHQSSWIYLRLFYTETALSWSDSDWAYRHMPLVFSILMLSAFAVLVLLRRRPAHYFPQLRLRLDFMSIMVISVVCVPAFTALIYMFGKYSLSPLHGVVEMNKSGCCTQGLVFPSQQVDGLIAFLSARGHGQTDSLIEEYADQTQRTRYALAPPQLQHVGLKSSRDNLDINTRSTWAFWFETNDPKALEKEHTDLLKDIDVENILKQE